MWQNFVRAIFIVMFWLGSQHFSSVMASRQPTANAGLLNVVSETAQPSGLLISMNSADPGASIAEAIIPANSGVAQPADILSTAPFLLGVWQPGAPWDMSKLLALETMIGGKVQIVHWYQGWGAANKALDLNVLQAVDSHGSIPLITWEPWDYTKGINQPQYKLSRIAAGAFDSYIRSWAVGLKSFGKPVFLRFAHEMNAPTYPWSVGANGNSAGDYIRAWRHVHDIFAQAGASNVLWVWSPNVEYAGTTPFADVYPGSAYVDWMALDGYNGGRDLPWGGWQSFAQIFGNSYRKLTALSSKPVMIAETASVEGGGSKAQWITDALTVQVPTNFPRIKAVVWFNERREADWRVNSSSTALAAIKSIVTRLLAPTPAS